MFSFSFCTNLPLKRVLLDGILKTLTYLPSMRMCYRKRLQSTCESFEIKVPAIYTHSIIMSQKSYLAHLVSEKHDLAFVQFEVVLYCI